MGTAAVGSMLLLLNRKKLRVPHFDTGETRADSARTHSHLGAAGARVAGHSATAISGATSSRQKLLFFLLSFGFPSGKKTGSQPLVIHWREWEDGEGSGK